MTACLSQCLCLRPLLAQQSSMMNSTALCPLCPRASQRIDEARCYLYRRMRYRAILLARPQGVCISNSRLVHAGSKLGKTYVDITEETGDVDDVGRQEVIQTDHVHLLTKENIVG